jgi:phospholipid:diacylglycerol acyltransferase
MKRYNPAGVKIKTVELPHEPDRFDIRGGPTTADHVDILGRPDLSELILKVVAGHGDDIVENYHSDILEIVERVPIYDDDD